MTGTVNDSEGLNQSEFDVESACLQFGFRWN